MRVLQKKLVPKGYGKLSVDFRQPLKVIHSLLRTRSSRERLKEILAFDVGTGIVGVLNVQTGSYSAYRGQDMLLGARRVFDCEGVIISFNGNMYDLPELAKRLDGRNSVLEPRGKHIDMREEASRDRWPPEHDTKPILGTNLMSHYKHYFGDPLPEPPNSLKDEYEQSNWRDCRMAADLWSAIFCD